MVNFNACNSCTKKTGSLKSSVETVENLPWNKEAFLHIKVLFHITTTLLGTKT